MSNQQMIAPNQLVQATQELSSIDLGNFAIPEKIQEKGANNNYYCIGVRARDSKDGFSKSYFCKVRGCGINQWNKMQRQIKQGIFKQPFADVYDRIIILHNPTIKVAPKAKKEKGLSPTQKKAVNALLEEGKGQDDAGLVFVAEEVGITLTRLKAYIQSF